MKVEVKEATNRARTQTGRETLKGLQSPLLRFKDD
jgi:hypothetical protein